MTILEKLCPRERGDNCPICNAIDRMKKAASLVEADSIPAGGWFIKRGGEYAYMRISEAAVRWMNLDERRVHGICYNGNHASVERSAQVRPASVEDYLKNIQMDEDWHKAMGCKGRFEDEGETR